MSKKPHNSIIFALVMATFLAGILMYALWKWINSFIHLPDWIFFLAYSLTVPTAGFYKAVYWGYWMANDWKQS